MMKVIARCNSIALVEDGGQLRVVDQGGAFLSIVVLVGVLLCLGLAANGALQAHRAPALAAALFAMSVAFGFAASSALRAIRERAERTEGKVRVIFDVEASTIRGPAGAALAPFARARPERTFQLLSSSQALTLRYPSGSIVLARGNGLTDNVEAIEEALVARGIPRPSSDDRAPRRGPIAYLSVLYGALRDVEEVYVRAGEIKTLGDLDLPTS